MIKCSFFLQDWYPDDKKVEFVIWNGKKHLFLRSDVIPIYFEGLNSGFFYRFARIRKKLGLKFNIEMIYLPSEMFKSKNKTFVIHIGKPIPWQTFDKSKSLFEWAQFVKDKVYELKK